jgi:hypothetical protein
MNMTRIRCPTCGTRLNEGALDRDIDLGDGRDVIIQEIGGRGSIGTVSSYDFASDDEATERLYEKVKAAYEYLSVILGIEEQDSDKS